MKTKILLLAALFVSAINVTNVQSQDFDGPRPTGSSTDGINITPAYNTNIQLTNRTWSGSHGILFNSYKPSSQVSGSLLTTGNTKYANGPGSHSAGAGAIMFFANGGRMDFLISQSSSNAHDDVNWDGSKMTIRRNGNIGISNTDPMEKLSITDGQIFIGNTQTNQAESGRLRFGEYTDKYQGAFVHYDGSTNFLNLGVHNTNDADPANDVNAISIKRETGHVAMGTTNMSYQLNIGGDLYFPEESGESGRVLFRAHSSDVAIIKSEQYGTGTGTRLKFEVHDDTDDYFSFNHKHHQQGDLEIFKMTRSKVTSAVNMDVNGIVRSKEVKVELENWPDYVFTPSYNLQSLSEVESFINQNGHLPNIPSAAEVEENNGIELGQMNAKLLEKIEELTLHLIEKDKEISELKETNKELAINQEKIFELLNQLKENKSTKSE
ncbi:MAG: hypothetical protein NXI20_18240 [bacterium]|nr:hypothetical protein [bacterium]